MGSGENDNQVLVSQIVSIDKGRINKDMLVPTIAAKTVVVMLTGRGIRSAE